ncbi:MULTISPECIES: TIM barrel protein [Cetobacterium]|jgi:sugar phosphate isomerase/epimerase|uniref:TIM barrel protein n=1 Tax=Candidatus Cetobacterium colombiensis TaxID=3073100 RepID=A0ABU4W7U7_9FUSO|nr:TIM barrel protein [Candidatus Cetobacterium colombiensis]MDX8335596.1 TIM barrel protein [Candidatus Cetobacterium colombiensis]
MKKNIFVSDLIFYNDTKEETLNFIETYNLKNIEFFLEPRDFNHTEKLNFLIKHTKLDQVSFHGPYRYFNIDCSDTLWEELKLNFVEALICCKKNNGEFLVLHTNESKKKDSSKKEIEKKLDELLILGKEIGVQILVENVGVGINMIYSQKEFEKLVLQKNLKVLIDIGHLLANKWDLNLLLKNLKNHIIAYHIHSNDGQKDLHESIFNDTFNGEEILKTILSETPNAKLVFEYSPITDKQTLLDDLKKIEEMYINEAV